MKKFCFATIVIILSFNSSSHTLPESHELLKEFQLNDSSSLYFNLFNVNFFWNNEYFNDIVPGYTLLGYALTPSIQYHFSPNIKLEAGVHMLKYSGVDKYSQIKPTYRATYQKGDFSFVMGTLYGTINHKLPEPLFTNERFYTHHVENGLQFILDKENFYIQSWLDWQEFITFTDNKQEELSVGMTSELFLLNKKWKLSVPVSLLAQHKGGQIGTDETPMVTTYNYGLGLKLKGTFSRAYIDEVSASGQYLGFNDASPNPQSIFLKGSGYLSDITLSKEGNFLKFGYWKSNNFLAPYGHPIYQSFSLKSSEKHKENRQLLTASVFYSKEVYKGIYLGAAADAYMDLQEHDFDYSLGVHLIVNQHFLIKKFKAGIGK